LNISGIATDPGGIISVTINGVPVQVGPDGSFSYPVQLLAGANTILIVVTGNSGRTTTVTRLVTLDSTAPSMTLSVSDNSSYSTPLLNLTGTVTGEGTLVTYMVNGGAPQGAIMNGGNFSFSASLAIGLNTIEVIASDLFGNSARIKRTITYAPLFTISLSDPLTDIHVATETYLLKGTISGNSSNVTVTISVNGVMFTPTVVNGLFQQKITFNGNGTYQVTVSGADQSSNSVTIQRSFIHADPTLDGTRFSIIDALQALKMAAGIVTPDSGQILRMDVAPLLNGVTMGNGKVDIEDALVILYLVVGLI
jgi:hypothetical protein